ncbi:MAG: thioesterase [Chitinophagaceae bacterium]
MNTTPSNAAEANSTAAFFRLVNSPLKFSLFVLKKLPAAYLAGLRITNADEARAVVTVPFKWFTQNPFRSTYFACLSMAAEMSTGLLAMANIYGRKPGVSMLVVDMKAQFHKKAMDITSFTCNDGLLIKEAVNRAIITKEAQTITVYSEGKNREGELIAAFWFTWSFKAK